MTALVLIRHALCDSVGRSIAGRGWGIHLNASGRGQAEALATRLAGLPISAIYSSPLERAQETAEPVARRLGLEVETDPGLNEVDFGDWTGRTLAELDGTPGWLAFNRERSTTRIPGGELIGEVLARALEACHRISRRHQNPGAVLALVSHGDVLRALIAHFTGIPLDLMQRIEISPASVSVLSIGPAPRLLLLNSTEAWPEEVLPRGGGKAHA
jgi:probable phosphoglycerate mutase